ncbi:MAG: PucR family transcriptional regulator [Clostridiaceae bacterium]|nr:PucR family transcriptional regulator [Clostridiaceae bacterium]
MAAKVFQSLVFRIKEIIGHDAGIADSCGLVVASTKTDEIGTFHEDVLDFISSNLTFQENEAFSMMKVRNRSATDFIVYAYGCGENCRESMQLICLSVENAKLYYEEKYDKNSFIKNILLGNILPGDISLRAKELRVKDDQRRITYSIHTEKSKDIHAYNIIKSLFPNDAKDFVILLDDQNTVLVKELKDKEEEDDIYRKARIIIDTLNTELMVKASVGIGTEVNRLRDISRSFKDAQTALTIGNIFDTDKTIIDYNHLGIGRLIYQLPTTLCKLFLNEVLKDGVYELIDPEMMITIQKFFENNLNVSETSRQLFVHRNTLVYRLDKIQKLTGMDLRNFSDAIHFKVAMMVKRYLDESGI